MRFVSYRRGGQRGYGLVQGSLVWSLPQYFPQALDLRSFIARGLLEQARYLPQGKAPDAQLADLEPDLPLPDPGKIICVGVNYGGRGAEYEDSREASYPSLFLRTPQTFVPHGGTVLVPLESEQLDYEGEIVLVIGRAGRRIPEAEAMEHVFGYTLMNEGTVRDWLRHAKFNVTQGKNFERSGALGPEVVTRDEVPDPSDIRLQTFVNGELRQDDTTAHLIHSFARLVAYISTFSALHPGDLIATGTPTGAGARQDPPRYLKPGDEVRVRAEGLGELRCTVALESQT